MAWTTPKTYATNEVLTSADMNAFQRDNMSFLRDPPSVHAFHGTSFNTSSGTFTNMPCNSERWDTDGMHSLVTNNSRITIQTAGRYMFVTTAVFDPNGTGQRHVRFHVNGGQAFQGDRSGNAGSGVTTIVSSTFSLDLAVGDFVEAQSWQLSGGTLAVQCIQFTAQWIGSTP